MEGHGADSYRDVNTMKDALSRPPYGIGETLVSWWKNRLFLPVMILNLENVINIVTGKLKNIYKIYNIYNIYKIKYEYEYE
jgi:hypothetical protein